MARDVIISGKLPKEKIENIKFLYIVIDSDYKVHYEFNNYGHIILPIHWSELNPAKIFKNLPENLIRKCESDKENIVGVLQLWIYYTKDYTYGKVCAIGLIETFQGNRVKALFKLLTAMDQFCRVYHLQFVETETSVIPSGVMKRFGFFPSPERNIINRFAQFVFQQKHYTKKYD